ncbi:OmpH family outer membrane protein [Mucilaginibacter sp. UR6-11]|uniref:OmpH family outer membrane protein n=1 Tax=Mucilaginibacter sp. UR6-11 TaxID=1435644 RepID=UPI001E62C1EE|nr:OmpH family outer membrane protein [Mucilaginibacter sp. UR6-11]MCC8423944.1 OmpH family outer membrane protein [Mucilaginibacter sp. UR6-11]
MKTTGSIFTKITLGLLAAATIVACNNNKPAATTAAPTTATTDKGTTVYINSDTLLNQYNYAKDMQTRLTEKGKAAQAEVASKEQALRREIADYQKDAATLPADKRQATEQRLAREQQAFQQFQQNEGAAFQSEQGAETNKLYQKTADFAKAYAKEKGYKLVLTYSKTAPGVLYVDPSLDVTAEVVKALNDAYAKDKK